jgi:hypothetical protein
VPYSRSTVAQACESLVPLLGPAFPLLGDQWLHHPPLLDQIGQPLPPGHTDLADCGGSLRFPIRREEPNGLSLRQSPRVSLHRSPRRPGRRDAGTRGPRIPRDLPEPGRNSDRAQTIRSPAMPRIKRPRAPTLQKILGHRRTRVNVAARALVPPSAESSRPPRRTARLCVDARSWPNPYTQ